MVCHPEIGAIRRLVRYLACLLLGAALAACTVPAASPGQAGSTGGEPAELLVFAASSLTDAVSEIASAFEAQNPQVTVIPNFAASSILATQLLEGAAADVFASANEIQMQKIVDAGRIQGRPRVFATNRLVIIVPADNPARIASPEDLARPGVKLLLAVSGVPIREYADRMFQALAADPAYGATYAGAVYANLVSEEENVRQVAAKVALGEADAGVVYTSDVTPDLAGRVMQIPVPDPYNVLATYPIALVSGTPQPALAQSFVDFVLGEEGQAILARWGLGPAAP
jgi:molybdate transport system substrate-binding protein